SNTIRVTAATLNGEAVHFDLIGNGVTADVARNAFATGRSPTRNAFAGGRSPTGEALLWALIVSMFVGAAVLARQNMRLGQGDRRAARELGVFVVCGSMLSVILHAHLAPGGLEVLTFLWAMSGYALVWGAFTWLMYISLEPHVRRIWPNTLISWTRLM